MSTVCVRIRLGAEHYAFDVSQVREVAMLRELTPVPGAPRAILGVINVKGQVLPVIDTAFLLGAVQSEPGLPARVVIVRTGAQLAALAVDEVIEVGPTPDPTEEPDSPLLDGAGVVDEKLVGFINLDVLLRAAA